MNNSQKSKTEILPREGAVWTWEPRNDYARCVVEIVEVRWNGEDWMVKTRTIEPAGPLGPYPSPWDDYVGKECWNELDRFMQASKRGRHGRRWRDWLLEQVDAMFGGSSHAA